MAELVYVDNSNVFIEGQRVQAVASGMTANIFEAQKLRILDSSFKIDFGKLHNFVAGKDANQIKRCMLFGSRPPPNDSLWNIARSVGFEVHINDRNIANREKKIDAGIITNMVRDAYTIMSKECDTITLVSGDKDFVPPVKQLTEDGFNVEVVFWAHAANELRTACSFISLDPYLNHLRLAY